MPTSHSIAPSSTSMGRTVGRPTAQLQLQLQGVLESGIEIEDALKDAPLHHAVPHACSPKARRLERDPDAEQEHAQERAALVSGVGDFSGFGWVNARGIWGSCA